MRSLVPSRPQQPVSQPAGTPAARKYLNSFQNSRCGRFSIFIKQTIFELDSDEDHGSLGDLRRWRAVPAAPAAHVENQTDNSGTHCCGVWLVTSRQNAWRTPRGPPILPMSAANPAAAKVRS